MCVSPRSGNGSSFPAHNFPAIQFKALDYAFEVRFKCVFTLDGWFIFLCELPSPFSVSENYLCESYYEFVGIT